MTEARMKSVVKALTMRLQYIKDGEIFSETVFLSDVPITLKWKCAVLSLLDASLQVCLVLYHFNMLVYINKYSEQEWSSGSLDEKVWYLWSEWTSMKLASEKILTILGEMIHEGL